MRPQRLLLIACPRADDAADRGSATSAGRGGQQRRALLRVGSALVRKRGEPLGRVAAGRGRFGRGQARVAHADQVQRLKKNERQESG